MIVDFHTHAFPDALAERAIPHLESEGDIKANLDGTVSSLIVSMDNAGIDVSVVASIATKPEQFPSILQWSKSIAGRRIIPFPSVHPADPDALEHISDVKSAGLRGIKLHPYYQDFTVDMAEVHPLYARIQDEGLVLLLHTGFDIAYERYRIADPVRIAGVIQKFPDLKLIASHFGAWEDWDEVESHLVGRNIFFDTSYSIPFMGHDRARRLISDHGAEQVLFGSDSPWGNQTDDITDIRQMGLEPDGLRCILGGNASALLNLE